MRKLTAIRQVITAKELNMAMTCVMMTVKSVS
jgi:hypothetical protein